MANLSSTQKKVMRIVLTVLVLALLGLGVKSLIDATGQKPATANTTPSTTESKSAATVAREFNFPLTKDAAGKATKEFKYTIEKAELTDEIIIKGQKATAAKGRDFLIVTIKLTNQHDQAFQLKTRDYVRLSINGNEQEWLAGDIHNDPVEVQAQSTKVTRVGWAVPENANALVLRAGEIAGNKETIALDL